MRVLILLLILAAEGCLFAAPPNAAGAGDLDVLYVFSEAGTAAVPEYVNLAADALGIEITSGTCQNAAEQAVLKHISSAVISAEAALGAPQCLGTLLSRLPKSTPVLFFGLRPEHEVSLRSMGAPVTIEADNSPQALVVHPSSMTSYFGGLKLDVRSNDGFSLSLPASEAIIGPKDSEEIAKYLRTTAPDGRELFLLADARLVYDRSLLAADNLVTQALPYLIFFSRMGGDRVWQGSASFANLTIDDPFLVEPYGSLSFNQLLQQMDSHEFHTTIGFIPRNFDRSEKEMVDLFRTRPDRFSIAVHGNNHDRREFYRISSKDWLEPFAIKTLQEQEFNLRQALIRMNEFSRLTGVNYDPVMIFPQGIAPASTLGLCKKVGYMATVNGSQVPLDSEIPDRIRMSFRPYNTYFHGFLSLQRERVDYCSELGLRADLFLGNPLLIYTHHDSFESGIDHFNSFADLINKLSPATKWTSLGNIISHWFLWRQKTDGVLEVKMLAPVCTIRNDDTDVKRYDLSKIEDDARILGVTVEGESVRWTRESDRIHFKLEIPPGETKQVRINYDFDVYPGSIGLNDGTPYTGLVYRGLAEFRDRVLSRFRIGRVARDFLYGSGISTWIPIIVISLVTIALSGVLIRRFSKSSSKGKSF